MADLISREAAIEAAIEAADNWDGGYNPNRETYITMRLNDVPAVDAAPVIHGHWIFHDDDMMPWIECSNCGVCTDSLNKTKYCPNCGSRMDGERRG